MVSVYDTLCQQAVTTLEWTEESCVVWVRSDNSDLSISPQNSMKMPYHTTFTHNIKKETSIKYHFGKKNTDKNL